MDFKYRLASHGRHEKSGEIRLSAKFPTDSSFFDFLDPLKRSDISPDQCPLAVQGDSPEQDRRPAMGNWINHGLYEGRLAIESAISSLDQFFEHHRISHYGLYPKSQSGNFQHEDLLRRNARIRFFMDTEQSPAADLLLDEEIRAHWVTQRIIFVVEQQRTEILHRVDDLLEKFASGNVQELCRLWPSLEEEFGRIRQSWRSFCEFENFMLPVLYKLSVANTLTATAGKGNNSGQAIFDEVRDLPAVSLKHASRPGRLPN